MGSLGAALGTMVANLSSHKRGWDNRWEEFSNWAEKGMIYQKELLRLVDEDTDAFNKIMDAFGLPKKTDEEKQVRKQTIENATKNAILVPFKAMETAYNAMEVIKAMAEIGNPNSVTDAGVGALALRACVRGAFLNVKINASGLEDKNFVEDIIRKCSKIDKKTEEFETDILQIVQSKIK